MRLQSINTNYSGTYTELRNIRSGAAFSYSFKVEGYGNTHD